MKSSWILVGLFLAGALTKAAGAEEWLVSDMESGSGELAMEAIVPSTPRWTWIAGAEATYLSLNAPDLESDRLAFSDLIDFGFEAAPRIWIGAQSGRGWGAQVRYWDYEAHASGDGLIDTVSGGAQVADSYAAHEVSTVRMYALDAEGTRTLQGERWWIQGSLGMRHGSLQLENLRGAVNFASQAATDAQSRLFTQDFFGTGLTSSIQVARRLGATDWEWFGAFRGSALWGHQTLHEDRNEISLGSPLINFSFTNNYDQTAIYILETQVGAQWSHYLDCCRGEIYLRTALEYQFWDMVTSGIEIPILDPSKDADLIGVAFSVGLRR